MKLGEALSARARMAQKMNDLRNRIEANAIRQGEEKTPEDAETLIEEYLAVSEEFYKIVHKINKVNASTVVDSQDTILGLLMLREMWARKRSVFTLAADTAGESSGRRSAFRYMRSELPTVPAVNVPNLRSWAKEAEEKVAELDAKIQTVNWQTDI